MPLCPEAWWVLWLSAVLLCLPGVSSSALVTKAAPPDSGVYPAPLVNQEALKTLVRGAMSEALCDLCLTAGQSSDQRCSCPAGFTSCAGRCYALLDRSVEYPQAELECAALEAHLAVPRGREQNLCVSGLAQDRGAWLGVTDREEEGVFKGADGLPVENEGQTWGEDQPNDDGGDQDCVHVPKMQPGFGFGQWNDSGCTGDKNYPLCQLR